LLTATSLVVLIHPSSSNSMLFPIVHIVSILRYHFYL
jgi:hypothetical protein